MKQPSNRRHLLIASAAARLQDLVEAVSAGLGLGQFAAALEGLGLEAAAHQPVLVETRGTGSVPVPARLTGCGAGWQRCPGGLGATGVALRHIGHHPVVHAATVVGPAHQLGAQHRQRQTEGDHQAHGLDKVE